MKTGFTLIELLVAVMIMAILVAMAVPMYERTIEKSRIAEARTMLKRLYDAKMRLLDEMEQTTYSATLFGLENLDYTLACTNQVIQHDHRIQCRTKNFMYSIYPTAGPTGRENGICAYRTGGENEGVTLLYKPVANNPQQAELLCHDNGDGSQCGLFGLNKTGSASFCSPGEQH